MEFGFLSPLICPISLQRVPLFALKPYRGVAEWCGFAIDEDEYAIR